MSANSLWHWLRSHVEPMRGLAWATGAHGHVLSASVQRPGARAVTPTADAATADDGPEKEWEPGVWARAAAAIYS
ncbi:hypothetical protein [Longimicrobium sp.]|uniref:hypothetical protein n=1 Tax=Longimicrobium sp. TaxID=2029185 RepID=UPI002D1621B7|nr:hypothetical protein [Longimicrobium sp.]HSU12613.1 hypothetical protein [Longimicrobium sp.]